MKCCYKQWKSLVFQIISRGSELLRIRLTDSAQDVDVLVFQDTISECDEDRYLDIGTVLVLKKYQIYWGQQQSYQASYLIFMTEFKCLYKDFPAPSGELCTTEDLVKGFRCCECKEVVGYDEDKDKDKEMEFFIQFRYSVCVVNVDSVHQSSQGFDENCCWQNLNCRECERDLGRYYVSTCREKISMNGTYLVYKNRVFLCPVNKKKDTLQRTEQRELIKKPVEVKRAIKAFKEIIGDLQERVRNLEENYNFI